MRIRFVLLAPLIGLSALLGSFWLFIPTANAGTSPIEVPQGCVIKFYITATLTADQSRNKPSKIDFESNGGGGRVYAYYDERGKATIEVIMCEESSRHENWFQQLPVLVQYTIAAFIGGTIVLVIVAVRKSRSSS